MRGCLSLATWCDEIEPVLKLRSVRLLAYLPLEAVVDLPAESALDLAGRLFKRVAARQGGLATADLLLGVEVFHVEREGNNVRVRSSSRIEPTMAMTDEYERLHKRYWDPLFRRQVLANHIAGRPLHLGFDRLFETRGHDHFSSREGYFKHDGRLFFTEDETGGGSMTQAPSQEPKSIESLIYQLVGTYISRRVESKHGVRWEDVKDSPGRKNEYEEARGKVAKDAFLAVRARTGGDFVNYFASTLCSVPQHVKEESYIELTRQLHSDTDRVRTLTLLALSARG